MKKLRILRTLMILSSQQNSAQALARWAADNVRIIKDLKPPQPPGFNNRPSANWKLLLQIAQRGARDFLRFGPFGLVVEAPVILLTCRLIGNRPFPSGRRSIVMITPYIAPRGERSCCTPRAVG